MKTITKKQLIELMSNIKESFKCEILAETEPRHTKFTQEGILNPYYKELVKQAKVNGIANWIYEEEVNRQRIRENKPADFEAEPRRWGERLQSSPFVVYSKDGQTRFYLEVKVEKTRKLSFFRKVNTKKFRLDYEDISPFLVPPNIPLKQQLDSPVILRDYALDNIRTISFLGQIYRIRE